jgi:hypothetical protein
MDTLYISIDESGKEISDECYAVVGCWFVSDRENPEQAGKPTRTKTQHFVQEVLSNGPSALDELRGSDMPGAVDDAINSVFNSAYDDETILQSHSVWPTSNSQPLMFSRSIQFPPLTEPTIGQYIGGNISHALKTIALVSVLSPLFDAYQVFLNNCDSIRVLLDATPWTTPANRVEQQLNELDFPPHSFSFEVRDSKATPGIQFADMGAYALRQRLVNDECNRAAEKIIDCSL